MHKLLVVFLAAYFTVNLVASDWHYPKKESNGVLPDKEEWGGMCESGKRQSPVDLATDAAIKGKFPSFVFTKYDQPMKNPKVENNGHSIQISSVPGPISISGGGLNGNYIFDQMHFHWASEHTINGGRFALELHIVHHDRRYDTLSRAAQEKNGIAVLGILFHVTDDPNPIVEKILENSKNVFDAAGRNTTYRDDLLLSELLPKFKDSYFRYEGSLTTPSCGEAVIWTVFDNSLPLSTDQLERFKSVHDQSGHELTHNYRHIQPLNSRSLIYVPGYNDVHGGSRAAFADNFAISSSAISIPLIIVTSVIALKGYTF